MSFVLLFFSCPMAYPLNKIALNEESLALPALPVTVGRLRLSGGILCCALYSLHSSGGVVDIA